MKDRAPKYPGRVKLTPVPGEENLFDLTRADKPTQYGTPLNTATLLKQQTAALFGLPESAVPDDAFAWLGKFNLHWWQRKNLQFRYITNVAAEAAVVLCTSVRNGTVSYSDLIDFDETTGALSLHSPQTATVSYAGETDSGIAFLRGKYFKFNSKIYYASETASYYCDRYSSPSHYGIYAGEVIVTTLDVLDVDYVHSSDRNAYPDSGESDGLEWRYLGVPFENAVTAPKVVFGSYVGTGKYGYNNPNSLTFPFVPKILVVSPIDGNRTPYIFLEGCTNVYANHSGGGSMYAVVTYGQTIKWYNPENANYQFNGQNEKFLYIAIG